MFLFRAQQGVPRTRATFVYYDGRGTLAGSADIERIQNADGSTTVVGHGGRFTKGTGRYAHFSTRGTHSFAGRRDPTTGVVTLTLRGALHY